MFSLESYYWSPQGRTVSTCSPHYTFKMYFDFACWHSMLQSSQAAKNRKGGEIDELETPVEGCHLFHHIRAYAIVSTWWIEMCVVMETTAALAHNIPPRTKVFPSRQYCLEQDMLECWKCWGHNGWLTIMREQWMNHRRKPQRTMFEQTCRCENTTVTWDGSHKFTDAHTQPPLTVCFTFIWLVILQKYYCVLTIVSDYLDEHIVNSASASTHLDRILCPSIISCKKSFFCFNYSSCDACVPPS